MRRLDLERVHEAGDIVGPDLHVVVLIGLVGGAVAALVVIDHLEVRRQDWRHRVHVEVPEAGAMDLHDGFALAGDAVPKVDAVDLDHRSLSFDRAAFHVLLLLGSLATGLDYRMARLADRCDFVGCPVAAAAGLVDRDPADDGVVFDDRRQDLRPHAVGVDQRLRRRWLGGLAIRLYQQVFVLHDPARRRGVALIERIVMADRRYVLAECLCDHREVLAGRVEAECDPGSR